MTIRVNNIVLSLDDDISILKRKVSKKLKISIDEIKNFKIIKESLDARNKDNIRLTYAVELEHKNEEKLVERLHDKDVKIDTTKYEPDVQEGNEKLNNRPVVVGFGPAGIFAALMLAEKGYKPLVIERGEDVDKRSETVDRFWTEGKLNLESNVQFGEGGAGAFSDGKLTTRIKDKRCDYVLAELVKGGAPAEIAYLGKPHVGTDILKDVVASIRKEIESLGGEGHFRTKVCDILCEKISGSVAERERAEAEKNLLMQDKQLTGLILEKEGVQAEYPCRNVIFAIGHSARDTFYMLHERELSMNPKAFAIGVRVEHLAHLINESQYGEGYPEEVPTASYKLTHQCKGTGRGIYSFCMCPGGYVVNSSSEKGRLCVNGMSYHDRAGHNSNTALITTVTPDDFPSDSPLAGLEFQRKYEELAYKIGNGKIPVQLFGDFLKNQMSTKLGKVTPSIKGEWQFANLHECLPDYVCASLEEGMRAFGHKIKGYDAEDTVFSGVETRTSSPLRMERNKQFESNIQGLFPCGEGAGYAGGITSAAMDGIKTAEAIAEKILTQN